jgi:hypothetical protein
MFMSSVVVSVHMCGWKGKKEGQWGLSKGTTNEAVDYEHEASKGGSLQLITKSHHSKKRVILYF